MTSPETTLPSTETGRGQAPAGSLRLDVMRQRSDFLAAARGQRLRTPAFLLQVRKRDDTGPARVGFTCSKKVGNAVARNAAKRRLRALAHQTLTPLAQAGHDYVLVGRADKTASTPFQDMTDDLTNALKTLQ